MAKSKATRGDDDLFVEEQGMRAMSFGEHIEELRTHLVLALIGLVVGVLITFIPPLNLGQRVMDSMTRPGKVALEAYWNKRTAERAQEAKVAQTLTPPVGMHLYIGDMVQGLAKVLPGIKLPPPESFGDATMPVRVTIGKDTLITSVQQTIEPPRAFISLAPLETATIYFMVCLVTGLVISSPWVFYQLWAFVAAGLYKHERHYVQAYLPFSLGLFLAGVFLCYFGVLPITLQFLMQFNVWLGIDPTLRLSDWMGFATILPLVFGASFQTPLIMMFLSAIGIFGADDYRSKRKIAILIMVVAAAVLTPGPDVSSQLLLAIPMVMLYELGILLVANKAKKADPVGVDD